VTARPNGVLAGCRPLLLGLGLLFAPFAAARTPIDARLADAEAAVVGIAGKSEDLQRQASPGRGFITDAQALQRYQEAVYDYFVGRYEQAAETFFTLVTTGALSDPGLDRDAEWYLAESFFVLGNLQDAEASFLIIALDDDHPFREDAVRRLLEVYASTTQSDKFQDLYQREIVSGRVAPSDLITYAVGKGFYQQGDLVRARSHLMDIKEDSPFYRRARYFLGAILVRAGGSAALDDALPIYEALVQLPVTTDEERQVRDLSLLAVGRIQYEKKDFAAAAGAYDKIEADSAFLADKLYEIVWTYIQQGDEQSALRAVEIFLLAFPEHRYTAKLQLLKGHLHYREKEFEDARRNYEQVVTEYTPIERRFEELSAAQEQPKEYFQKVLRLDAKRPSDAGGLPSYAIAMMMSDKDLSRAISVYKEMERQETTLDASERLIDELTAIIGTEATIGGFEYLRYDVVLQQGLALEQQLSLLALEEEWLVDAAGAQPPVELLGLATKRAELEQLASTATSRVESLWAELDAVRDRAARQRSDREGLLRTRERAASRVAEIESRLSQPDVSPVERSELEDQLTVQRNDLTEVDTELRALDGEREMDDALITLEDESAALVARLDGAVREMRGKYAGHRMLAPDRAEVGARFERIHDSLDRSLQRLREVQVRLEDIESSELGRIRQRFREEVTQVTRQRVELDATYRRAESVSVDLTRDGFDRLASFFADSVLRADMGIVDVYWAGKESVRQEYRALQDERTDLVAELERRFAVIRQKLPERETAASAPATPGARP
jgi:TolA-binding protein